MKSRIHFPIFCAKNDREFKSVISSLILGDDIESSNLCSFDELPKWAIGYSELFLEYLERVYVKYESLAGLEERIIKSTTLTSDEKKTLLNIVYELSDYIFHVRGRFKLIPQIVISSDRHRIFMYPYHAKKTSILYPLLKNILTSDHQFEFHEFDINSAIPRSYMKLYKKDIYDRCKDSDDFYKCLMKLIGLDMERNEFKRLILSAIHSHDVMNKVIQKYPNINKLFVSDSNIDNVYNQLNKDVLSYIRSINAVPIYLNLDGGLLMKFI